MNDEMSEKLAIREVIENWVLWSDAGDWERFRTVWHDGAFMSPPGLKERPRNSCACAAKALKRA